MTSWITICDTCKTDEWDATRGQTDGEALADLVTDLVESHPDDRVQMRRVSCLMGCKRACNITIQSDTKIAYTLGEFTPDTQTAASIVEFAQLHSQSETGQVPYRQWPEGVKGHFVTRHFPVPK